MRRLALLCGFLFALVASAQDLKPGRAPGIVPTSTENGVVFGPVTDVPAVFHTLGYGTPTLLNGFYNFYGTDYSSVTDPNWTSGMASVRMNETTDDDTAGIEPALNVEVWCAAPHHAGCISLGLFGFYAPTLHLGQGSPLTTYAEADGAAGSTIDAIAGAWIDSNGVNPHGSTGTVLANYGIRIDPQTGATYNAELYLKGNGGTYTVFQNGKLGINESSATASPGAPLEIVGTASADVVKILTNNARVHLGTGTNDYLYSNGSGVIGGGDLRAGDAVANGMTLTTQNSGTDPSITLNSSDTNRNLNIVPKGTGVLNVNGNGVPTVQAAQTTAQQSIAFGTKALASGAGTVTFSTAFSAAPVCGCTDQTTAAATKCSTSTTTLTIAGTSTDTVAYICIGAK